MLSYSPFMTAGLLLGAHSKQATRGRLALTEHLAGYESRFWQSGVLASVALRIYDDLPLSVSATHDGACVVHRVLEMEGTSHGRKAICRCSAVLGEDLWSQLCRRRRDRNSDGVPVWHELGCIYEILGRSNWADARHGRHVRISSRKRDDRRVGLGGKAPLPAHSLPGRSPRRNRMVPV